jgi:phage tail-like protein
MPILLQDLETTRGIGMFGGRKALAAVAVVAAPLVGIFAVPALVEAATSEPEPVARVSLTIDGYELASFSRCIGLGSESEVTDAPAEEGEVILRRLPGPTTGRTVCERTLGRNIEMASWRELVVLGDVAAASKDVSITMYDASGTPQYRWHLTHAWPSGLTNVFGADGMGREIVTFAYEMAQRVAV